MRNRLRGAMGAKGKDKNKIGNTGNVNANMLIRCLCLCFDRNLDKSYYFAQKGDTITILRCYNLYLPLLVSFYMAFNPNKLVSMNWQHKNPINQQ